MLCHAGGYMSMMMLDTEMKNLFACFFQPLPDGLRVLRGKILRMEIGHDPADPGPE
jgi:hypothetical protein